MLVKTPIKSPQGPTDLESYFQPFREGVIGISQKITTPFHDAVEMIYADWTASGRCYGPIEYQLIEEYMPFMANTHTESNATSSFMTTAYHQAREKIKNHVNASEKDILIAGGSGATDMVNKLQRILGLRIPEQFQQQIEFSEEDTPVVFITHMEHHSNHTSWLETIGDVVVIPPGENGKVCVNSFEKAIREFRGRKLKIAAITACSNVTGLETPLDDIARLIHKYGGYCFVDFACSAPYVNIDMHPANEEARLDAIYFSPHKFLGGPGSSGVLILNSQLYKNLVPDISGGGTVDWTNPWGGRKYVDDIEAREDGGTPPILQTIKSGLAIDLKEKMGVQNILKREKELMHILWNGLKSIAKVRILSPQNNERLGIVSFYVDGMHHDKVVKRLNDRYGIQSRGGCSCAGTYGHFLLNVNRVRSKKITDLIDQGDNTQKPGWIRLSIHPVMTNKEAKTIVDAVKALAS